jgi:[ribosomal protein S5]-alanine N-acetyltransferase
MTIVAMPAAFTLETERLYLSAFTPEVCHHLFTACSDSEIMDYMGFKTKEELADEKEKFSKGLTTFFHTFRNFRVVRKSDGIVMGRCGYHTWCETHRRAEVGYFLLDDSYKEQGYMTEALGAVLAHGFEVMGLQRIEAYIADYNTPSKKLLERYGFKCEGIAREHYVVNNINEDSVLLSIIRSEYEQLKHTWNLNYKLSGPVKV